MHGVMCAEELDAEHRAGEGRLGAPAKIAIRPKPANSPTGASSQSASE